MSYTDVQTTPAQRLKGMAGAGGIQALIVLGVATGFTVTSDLIIDEENLRVVEYKLPEDPPPPSPTVEPQDIPQYAAPSAPTPKLDMTDRAPVQVEPFDPDLSSTTVERIVGPGTLPRIAPPLPTPSVAPSFAPVGASPLNGPLGWISNNDYPRRDLTRGNEGTASYNLVIGSDGRVDACEIVASSGHSGLDRATCRLIESRARFDPATGSSGSPIVGTYSGSVTWQIPL